MKTAIQIIVILLLILWVGGFEFSLKPFVFKFNDWRLLFALVCLTMALSFYQSQARLDGYKKGLKDGIAGYEKEVKKEFHLIPKEDEEPS